MKAVFFLLILGLNSKVLADIKPANAFDSAKSVETSKVNYKDWALFSLKVGAMWAGLNLLELNIKGRDLDKCKLNNCNLISPEISIPEFFKINIWENRKWNPSYSSSLEASDKMLVVSFFNGVVLGAVVYPFYKWEKFFLKFSSPSKLIINS